MSTTGTRPPLFDPEPGSFDDDVDAPLFPHRPGGGRRAAGRQNQDDSPRWVRPFLLGGLVLVAILSLLAFLGDGANDPAVSTGGVPAEVGDAPVADDPAAQDVAADDVRAGADSAGDVDAEADADADADATGDVPDRAAVMLGSGDDQSLAGDTGSATSTTDLAADGP